MLKITNFQSEMLATHFHVLTNIALVVVISIILFFIEHYIVQKFFLNRQWKYWQFYFLKAIDRPLKILIILIGATFIVEIFYQTKDAIGSGEKFHTTKLIIVVSTLTWTTLSFIKRLERHFLKYNSFSNHKDKDVKRSTTILLMKLCFATTLVIAVLILLQTLGVGMQAIITFVSLGGVAIGLASRDLNAGLFGTMMIYANRPFSIGDRIKFNAIEGVVENITWISTSVRLDNKKIAYVPNVQFLTSTIENATESIEGRLVILLTIFGSDLTSINNAFEEYQSSVKTLKLLHKNYEIEPSTSFEILEIQEIKVLFKCKFDFSQYTTQSDLNSIKDLLANKMMEIFNKHNLRFSSKFEE